jgi:hypothetical protein
MACRLSDAKEYGEFEEQGGWCRCDIPYENWVVVKICLIEVPMCAKIVRNSVKIGRHTVEIAGEISEFFQKIRNFELFFSFCSGKPLAYRYYS